ncbi:hypothetical protein V2W45_1197373, partial [Cenococcum geophilum]
NYKSNSKLASLKKSIIGNKRDKTAAMFTPYYQLLIPYVNRLRRAVFPSSRRWRDLNLKLYSNMEILQATSANL